MKMVASATTATMQKKKKAERELEPTSSLKDLLAEDPDLAGRMHLSLVALHWQHCLSPTLSQQGTHVLFQGSSCMGSEHAVHSVSVGPKQEEHVP